MTAAFDIPEGWCVQAFRFTLDPSEDQVKSLARHFGARRRAYNWTVATLKGDIVAWHARGVETAKPSLRVLRKRWNAVKSDVCVSAETGQVWWPECSKEAYADGIAGRWTRTGTGSPEPVRGPASGLGFRDSNAKAATLTGCASPPERCASSPTAATSPCR